jgi:hypothetical protein
LSSIADRRVDTLQNVSEIKGAQTGVVFRNVRLGEHMIFALHIVQPSTYSEEALVGCKKLLRFGGIDKSDGV